MENEPTIEELKAQGFHFRATADGEVQFTPEEEMEWTAEQEAQALPVVPSRIPAWRAKHQLFKAGLYDQARTAVAVAGAEAQFFFDNAPDWLRDDPFIQQLGPGLGLTDEQVDAMFIAASREA